MKDIIPLSFITPVRNNLYVTVEDKADKISTIILPENARMRSQVAIVRAVGPEIKDYKIGDKILITFHAGIHLQLPDTYSVEDKHRIISDHEILAKVQYEGN